MVVTAIHLQITHQLILMTPLTMTLPQIQMPATAVMAARVVTRVIYLIWMVLNRHLVKTHKKKNKEPRLLIFMQIILIVG